MKAGRTQSAPAVGDELVPLDSILCTEELQRRPSRPPDYEAENRALVNLARGLADSPKTILQTLADTVLEAFQSGSAGISLLTPDGLRFYWPAIAGAWAPHIGGGTPRAFGPCGDVLDCDAPLLFTHWEKRYPYLLSATPLAEEGLLIPFYLHGKALGTLWAITHDEHRRFDTEDLRQLKSIGRFASAAYQAAINSDADEARRAALNLMEDAVESSTAMEKLNAALRASEEHYRGLFESIDEGFCVAELLSDATGQPVDYRFLQINSAFAKQTGYADVVDRTAGEIFPNIEQEWLETFAGVVRTGETVRFDYYSPEADRWFEVHSYRVGTAEQRQFAILFNDITERRQNEVALRESESRKDAILTSALDAIITMDHEGRLVEFNPAAEHIFGHARADVLGRPLEEVIIPKRLRKRHKIGLKHYLTTGVGPLLNQQIELPALRADGTEFPAELAIIVIPGIWPPVFTAFLRDVTARKHLEHTLVARAEDLARADRTKDEFLAMLAHELRNPLAPLQNATEILQSTHVSSEERVQAQRIISRQIENMSRMIDDLLDVSRITEGKIDLRKETVSLESILSSAVNLARSGCAARGQDLALSMPAEPIYLDADATRLEQVFGNLLTNACKYGGDGCHITLSAERDEGEVIITVSDDGAGIAPEVLPHIFELFVQATRTLDRKHGGLGIGLTLVQRLVKLHDGTIEARSEGPDCGADFIVRLPILDKAPSAVIAPTALLITEEISRRIMIVDDNTDSARSLATLQTRRGHVTRTAFTGPDAVAAAADFLPEVVLLDIGLPGMDGFEVARQIRAMPALKDIFLIAMSGYGRPEDRAEAHLAGFDKYMVKPVNIPLLREWLDSREKKKT